MEPAYITDLKKFIVTVVDVQTTELRIRIDELDERLSKRIDELDERLSNRIDELDARLSRRIDELSLSVAEALDTATMSLTPFNKTTKNESLSSSDEPHSPRKKAAICDL